MFLRFEWILFNIWQLKGLLKYILLNKIKQSQSNGPSIKNVRRGVGGGGVWGGGMGGGGVSLCISKRMPIKMIIIKRTFDRRGNFKLCHIYLDVNRSLGVPLRLRVFTSNFLFSFFFSFFFCSWSLFINEWWLMIISYYCCSADKHG